MRLRRTMVIIAGLPGQLLHVWGGHVDVGFAAWDGPEEDRDEIEHVLFGITWPDTGSPERLTVRRLLIGGRSGARVLEVDVERDSGRVGRRVVKIDRASAVAQEWRAFIGYLQKHPQASITPVETVSEFVRMAPNVQYSATRAAAIVYVDVADYAGIDEPAVTLEDVVREAINTGNTDQALPLIVSLLQRVTNILHRPISVRKRPRKLTSLDSDLGVDMVLEVDHVSGSHGLGYQGHDAKLTHLHRLPADVLAASTTPPHDRSAGPRSITEGDVIALDAVRLHATDTRLRANYDRAVVEIRASGSAPPDLLSSFRPGEGLVTVVGRVAEVRSDVICRRINEFVPGFGGDAPTYKLDGLTIRHPLARLQALLTEDVPGRATAALAHGDLNPRNVLVVAGQVFLIDFAYTAPGRSPSWDAAWLETCLMRDVIAPALSAVELVRLQRLLGAVSRTLSSTGDNKNSPTMLQTSASASVKAAYDVLRAIRTASYREYLGATVESASMALPWWRDYLAQLTFAACRTLRWPVERQSEEKVRASSVLAGVAAEWLGTRPCRDWEPREVRALARQLASAILVTSPQESAVVLEILIMALRDADQAQFEEQGLEDGSAPVWEALEQARAALVVAAFSSQASRVVTRLHAVP